MRSIFFVFTVLVVASLFPLFAVGGKFVDDFELEREVALLAIDLLPLANIDLVECVKELLYVTSGKSLCDTESLECQMVVWVSDAMALIDVNPLDIIIELFTLTNTC